MCEVLPFDFIVCDYNLGEGKDGYQFFEELKIRKPAAAGCGVYHVSAETKRQEVHDLVEPQPDDYLLKPFTYKTLEWRLLRAFYKKRHTCEVYRQQVFRLFPRNLKRQQALACWASMTWPTMRCSR